MADQVSNSKSLEPSGFAWMSNDTSNDTSDLPFGADHFVENSDNKRIRDIIARCVPYPHSADSCPGLWTPGMGNFARNVIDPTGRVLIETKPYSIARFHHGAWVGMAILAAVLLILCALFAGLTLAVCGLDATLLQLRCITGTPRERYVATCPCKSRPCSQYFRRQARMVAGMKRRATWMLCKHEPISRWLR